MVDGGLRGKEWTLSSGDLHEILRLCFVTRMPSDVA